MFDLFISIYFLLVIIVCFAITINEDLLELDWKKLLKNIFVSFVFPIFLVVKIFKN